MKSARIKKDRPFGRPFQGFEVRRLFPLFLGGLLLLRCLLFLLLCWHEKGGKKMYFFYCTIKKFSRIYFMQPNLKNVIKLFFSFSNFFQTERISWCNFSFFVFKYFFCFSLCAGSSKGICSTISSPYPSKPITFFGLFVISRIFPTPSSLRI